MRVKNPLGAVSQIALLRAPIEAQLIVTRRCNLSCGYCTEYDNISKPVPLDTLKERIDALHRLKVVNIAMLGGEPLMHPQIADVVAYANRRAQVSITTNGFLLSDKLIERLNGAGLSNLQLSIDALEDDASGYIQKSLKPIAPKLERLKELARFDVHATVVLCEESKRQFMPILRKLAEYGFFVSVNLIHDDHGTVGVEGPEFEELWERHFKEGSPFSFIEYEYGKAMLRGERPQWKCRAGSRFLYVDEFGKAQFCSAQMGRLDKPITEYTWRDVREHSTSEKGCESGCALWCVYRNSQLDNAPLSLAKSMVQAFRRGSLFRGRAGKVFSPPGEATEEPAL